MRNGEGYIYEMHYLPDECIFTLAAKINARGWDGMAKMNLAGLSRARRYIPPRV